MRRRRPGSTGLWTNEVDCAQPMSDCRIAMSWDAPGRVMAEPSPRFLLLADVADVLNISSAQAYALVRNGDLPAIKVGGRGQWRVEATELEAYIQRLYAETRDFVESHPLGPADGSGRERSAGDADEGKETP